MSARGGPIGKGTGAARRSGQHRRKEGKNAGPNRRQRVRRGDEGGLQFAHHVHLRVADATMQADDHVPRRGNSLTCDLSLERHRIGASERVYPFAWAFRDRPLLSAIPSTEM